jgi:hypothetical protein
MTDLEKLKVARDAALAAHHAAGVERDAVLDAYDAAAIAADAARAASAAVRDIYATYNAILAAQKQETPNE